ncbi:hypothetical protein AWB78_08391 [Caballeronia calidae]|uniref:Uncharacterized protein n=1 Tax=Caballeronia calidae TaxID=1777139 RepID=A0A158EJR2_9BURK|nr:hypothetical protein AWB78_08391 [Caballeronia calidae]
MSPGVLNEHRLMASARFDSQPLLCIVLAGDTRLTDKLRRDELLPLGSRIRSWLATEKASTDDLQPCLEHLLVSAGAPQLMTPPLRHTLCKHALSNYRVLTTVTSWRPETKAIVSGIAAPVQRNASGRAKQRAKVMPLALPNPPDLVRRAHPKEDNGPGNPYTYPQSFALKTGFHPGSKFSRRGHRGRRRMDRSPG